MEMMLQGSTEHIAWVAHIDMRYNAERDEKAQSFLSRHPAVLLEESEEWQAIHAEVEVRRQKDLAVLRDHVF